MSLTRRQLLVASGAVGTAALAGCLGGGGGGYELEPRSDAALDSPAANAPLPESPGDHTYATMGSSDAPKITYFGNWKCPACKLFSTDDSRALGLSTIVTDYVEPGDLALEFRALSYGSNGSPFLGEDAPRAAQAGLAVWNVDPEHYWPFHEYVFANQPPEDKQWATTENLKILAEEAGVNSIDEFESQLDSGQYEDAVKATTDAANQASVSGTPTLVIDGTGYSPFEKERTRSAIESLVNGGN
ncbi:MULTISPECIES: DsbA family protein [unclassified Haladaptatus]|uniref:DsbA family protein n=1 Tax=unclassified Haladaptatus TaxID=2622732 RepID=UPI0023E8E993|nr:MULTISPECIES: DsbA family protein [unclassified Haladaptatus]